MKESTGRTAALHAGVGPDVEAGPHEDEYIFRFGSRLGLDLGRGDRALLPAGLGPLNTNLPIYLAVETPEGRFSMPTHYNAAFVRGETVQLEHSVERSMTRLRFRGESQPADLRIEWEFLSPFYPQDDAISTAPVFLVTCRMTPQQAGERAAPSELTVLAGLEATVGTTTAGTAAVGEDDAGETAAGETTRGANMITQDQQVAANFRGPETKPGDLLHCSLAVGAADGIGFRTRTIDNGAGRWLCLARRVKVTGDAGNGAGAERVAETVEVSFYLAAVTDGVVDRLGESCPLAYRRDFADAASVLAWARQHRAELVEKSSRFDELFMYASIPDHIRRFAAWQFHIFLGSTWLLRRPDGSVFYTNYEGGTGYFSTVDVEYNLVPIYLMFRPQCLVDQLELWAEVYRRGNRQRPYSFGPAAGIMEHDVGGGFQIDEQIYMPGPMPVEENANFILMHYLYWRWTGDEAVFARHAALCRELADYVVASDTNGNGLPNLGTNNTFDAFEPLFRDTEDQVYLGIKAGAALQGLSEMLAATAQSASPSPSASPGDERYAGQARRIFETLENEAWRGDHYAVSISPQAPAGPTGSADRDAPSPLTLNGLAYLLFAGTELLLDRSRMRADLLTAATDYTQWPSMGVWRDMLARYLSKTEPNSHTYTQTYTHPDTDTDTRTHAETFDPQGSYRFRPDFRNDMYPRSATALFMLNAWAGVAVNMVSAVLSVSRAFEGVVPLPALADWEAGVVPWLKVQEGRVTLESPTRLCEGLTIRAL